MSTSAIVIRTLFSFPSPLSNRCRGFQQSAGIIVMENSVALERSTNLFRSRTTVKDPKTLRPGDYKSCRRRTFLRNLILPLPLSLSLSPTEFFSRLLLQIHSDSPGETREIDRQLSSIGTRRYSFHRTQSVGSFNL